MTLAHDCAGGAEVIASFGGDIGLRFFRSFLSRDKATERERSPFLDQLTPGGRSWTGRPDSGDFDVNRLS